MTSYETQWWVRDEEWSGWFETTSLIEGVALARAAGPDAQVDVRPRGVGVRVRSAGQAGAVFAAAREQGLAPDPGVLQRVGVVLESPDPSRLDSFWCSVLGYDADGDLLSDPLHRDPALRLERSGDARPLRNRLHLDVVRPGAVVERVEAGEPGGPYGVRHADGDGNEVDLVPGDPLAEGEATADWQSVFGAVACYRITSPEQQHDLASAVAALADEAGFPLLLDLRPGLVVLDTGKDRWHPDAHGLDLDFTDLAARVQTAARGVGANPAPELARCVQLFLDAADVERVRTFWAAALGYDRDCRDDVTDLVDPRRLGPVIAFQPLDADDDARRAQRDRLHVELTMPASAIPSRVEAMLAAGGRLAEESSHRSLVLDPEGNEVALLP